MEKVSLPTKTKIAAWWMIIVTNVVFILASIVGMGVLCIMAITYGGAYSQCRLILIFPFLPLINLIFSVAILKRKKWAWWGSIVLIPIMSMSSWLILFFYGEDLYRILFWFPIITAIAVIMMVSFILLLLDRKNFWKVAK